MLSLVLACFWSPQRRDCEINKVGGEVFMTTCSKAHLSLPLRRWKRGQGTGTVGLPRFEGSRSGGRAESSVQQREGYSDFLQGLRRLTCLDITATQTAAIFVGAL